MASKGYVDQPSPNLIILKVLDSGYSMPKRENVNDKSHFPMKHKTEKWKADNLIYIEVMTT